MTNIDSARAEAEKLLEGGKWFNADGPLYKMMVERVAQALAALMVERDAEWNKGLETGAKRGDLLLSIAAVSPFWKGHEDCANQIRNLVADIRALRRPDAPANTEMPGEDVKSVICEKCGRPIDTKAGYSMNANCTKYFHHQPCPTPTIEELRAKVIEAALAWKDSAYGDCDSGDLTALQALMDATKALQAAQQPGGA